MACVFNDLVKNVSVPRPRVSSVSRRSTITTSPTKELQISLHPPDDALDAPDRGAKLETPDELARNGEISGRVPSLGDQCLC
jgi:hypothetical protein